MQGGHSPGKQGNQGKVRGGDFFDEKVRDIYEKLSGKNENVLTNALRKCWHPAFSFHIFSKDMSYQCYVLLYCWQIGVGGGGGHFKSGKICLQWLRFFSLQQGQLVLASPNLKFCLRDITDRVFTFLMSSDYERNEWRDTIKVLQAKRRQLFYTSFFDW